MEERLWMLYYGDKPLYTILRHTFARARKGYVKIGNARIAETHWRHEIKKYHPELDHTKLRIVEFAPVPEVANA